ncbi:MAG: hypothetical protein CMP21_03745 [Rickettsiales bacterium]|nr:hypothetical protein [Rickettsiales bacterium]|tara:strand:- start:1285 stop:3120 length:1836 start_codon:yes stop_codon:yes gene_type:complete
MSNIKVTDLDFDILKENLKDFLRGQEEFQDYDFDGSGLQILLDILSANTHYNAIYQNMVANEMFLDSAVLRESVVSRSKALGYTPSSIKSAQVEVTLSVVEKDIYEDQPSSVALPQYSNFSASKDGVTYIFQNLIGQTLADSEETDSGGRKIYSGTFTINQGIMVEQNFEVKFQEDPNQRYVLDNLNIDISTLIVRVKQNPQDSNATYDVSTLAENVVELGPNDNVYWVNENESGKYELFFGNGRIGKKLSDGTLIKIQYLTTSGPIGNNIDTGFTFSDVINTSTSSYELKSISRTSSSFGGAEKESLEEIRFTSPKYYEMQNRSVTALDYKYLVQKKYQNIESIKTWGGEDNDPVYYGRVFISLKPKTGFFITDTAKKSIVNDIVKDYNVVTIDAEIVEPEYTFIELTTEVKYNLREVPQGEEYVKSLVLSSIQNFNQNNLGKFDSYFRFSRLISTIDDSSDAIKSNISTVKIKNRLIPNLGISSSYVSRFNAEVSPGTLSSSNFTYEGITKCLLEDDSLGNINVVSFSGNVKLSVKSNIGTVDYNKGSISLNGFSPTEITNGDDYINLILTPKSSDLSPLRNQILEIDSESINISMNNISEQFLTQNEF